MDNQIILKLTSSALAAALGLKTMGPDLPILCVAPFSALIEGALCFSKHAIKEVIHKPVTVIVALSDNLGPSAAILSNNPRLDFARALAWIDEQHGIARPTVPPIIHPTAKIGRGVVLGNGVTIGANSIIHHNVVIGDGVIVGERCVVKSCAVIGEDGFGFERDEHGLPVRLVHLGTVVIGNDVEIGSLTTVCRGTLDDTVIEDHVKIDDHVHIAHNVKVRRAAMIIACAEVSGGVEVGEQAWIGPNASVIQKVKIGPQSVIGIGANVIRSVESGATVAGNPAKVLGR
ncbi:UDP-3-O-(3-hydroxymyristoyl)glucosamine N-acyltransferase [Polaromonas glacialis]|uniref:UDP-3-O-(3-hydroxymyristoyl)glucosamine N-acyltransferase n=1 Tax=Polaromonas glacialis TaxID=866564 RepID=UPI000A00DB89|nr:UDP-3-O-(3-hydroxymyristoyl)glucosamine N-acyltransferase [Polaromonas glacialis]